MSGYLDKEAVLKAVKDAFSNPEHIVGLLMRIERGEFDAKSPIISQWQLEQYNIAHEKAVAEKDAEIVRLNNIWNAHHSKCDERFSILSREHDNTIILVQKLKDRIAQQDQELKDLGEALRKSEKAVKCDGCHPKPCSGCRWENERCKHRPYAKGDHSCRYFEEPPKDEPEMVICPDGDSCDADICAARAPHKKIELCDDLACPLKGERSGPCIPYKKEPAKAKEHDDVCDSLQYVWVKHDLKKDGGVDYPGMVKDIGNLTLRADLMDSRQAHDFRMITHLNEVLSIVGEFGSDRLYKIEERIGALEKKVK
jgi:hypothetical protein